MDNPIGKKTQTESAESVNLGGKVYDLSKLAEWSEEEKEMYQIDLMNHQNKLEGSEGGLAPAAEHKAAMEDLNPAKGYTVSELAGGLLVKSGLSQTDAQSILQILSRGTFKESFATLSKALLSLQHVAPDANLQTIEERTYEKLALLPAYDLDAVLCAKTGTNAMMELPSRAYKTAVDRLANRAHVAEHNTQRNCETITMADGTTMDFRPLADEENENLRRNEAILSRYSSTPVEFFRVQIERMVRFGLYLHPHTVRDGKLEAYSGTQWVNYQKIINPVFIKTLVPAPVYVDVVQAFHRAFVKRLERAKQNKGLEANPVRHACLAIHENGFAPSEVEAYNAAAAYVELEMNIPLPQGLGEEFDRLRADAPPVSGKVQYGLKDLAELNPEVVLAKLADYRKLRNPGNAMGADWMAEASTLPFQLHELQTATAYKVAAPIIDAGALELLKDSGAKIALIGIDKGPELTYFWAHKDRVEAYDVVPCKAYGFAVNYLDVLRLDEAAKILQGRVGLFFDVASNETGRNTDPAKVALDCSFVRNMPLFYGMCRIIEAVKPKLFTLKTFIPNFPTRAGLPVWEGFDVLYRDYDLECVKTGKMHNDEYTLVGKKRKAARTDEEMLAKGRAFFIANWRALGAKVLAGNAVAMYCLALGRDRLSFTEREHNVMLPGGTKGLPSKMLSPYPAGKVVPLGSGPKFRCIHQYLNQCAAWHAKRELKYPYLVGTGTADHVTTKHKAEEAGSFEI